MQIVGRQPQRAPDDAPVHCERHRPEQTTLHRLVQRHAATFFAQAEDAAGADLPQFVKDGFEAFLECGILAHGFLRLRCGDCGHDKPVARRGLLEPLCRYTIRPALANGRVQANAAGSPPSASRTARTADRCA